MKIVNSKKVQQHRNGKQFGDALPIRTVRKTLGSWWTVSALYLVDCESALACSAVAQYTGGRPSWYGEEAKGCALLVSLRLATCGTAKQQGKERDKTQRNDCE